MRLEHLKTFHHVALEKSFSKAAKKLFLTQPAITRQIQGLEHDLKVKLFDRTKRQIDLTEQGKILFSYTRELFSLFGDIENAFQDFNDLTHGQLTVAASALVGTYFLPKIFAIFNQRYPNIDIKLRVANSGFVSNWVLNREVDLGLCGRIDNKPDLVQYQLLNEPFRPVASPSSHWARLGRPLTQQEYALGSIVSREQGSRMQTKLSRWFEEHDLTRTSGKFIVDSMAVAKHCALAGLGIVTLPELATRDEIVSGELVDIEVEDFRLNTGYYLIYRENANLSPAALKFLMLLKEHRRDFLAIL